MVMMRAAAPSTYILAPRSEAPPSGTPPLLPIPLPTSSPPLLLPSTDCRADVPEVTLPPRKRLCIAPGPRYEVGECSSAPTARPTGGFRADYGFVGTLDAEIRRDPDREIGYGITDVWVDPDEIAEEIPATDVAELGQRMTDFVTTVRQDTYEIYGRLDDAQDDRLLMSGQLNLLRRDRRSHARTARLMESEARASREAWVQSMDASDMARSETQMAALQSQQTPARIMPLESTNQNHKFQSPATTTHTTTPDDCLPDKGTDRPRGCCDCLACTYPDIMICKPLYFKGIEGVFELTQWFERMETVFRISNCTMENQIKFATCTLLGSALTWWNSHVRTVGHDVAYAMTWTNLKKMMTDKYCPWGKIKKLEVKMWNLKVEGTDVVGYNQRFQKLALMCARMFLEESDKIERYVGGLPDDIR
ncbi:reverse transcriptase domain-containing protein [Tanacetum coccineum]